jgi:hypothetical protein
MLRQVSSRDSDITNGLWPVASQVPGASLIPIEPFGPTSTDLLLPLELVNTTVPGNGREAVTPVTSRRPDTVPGGVDCTAHPDASSRRETDEATNTLGFISTSNHSTG